MTINFRAALFTEIAFFSIFHMFCGHTQNTPPLCRLDNSFSSKAFPFPIEYFWYGRPFLTGRETCAEILTSFTHSFEIPEFSWHVSKEREWQAMSDLLWGNCNIFSLLFCPLCFATTLFVRSLFLPVFAFRWCMARRIGSAFCYYTLFSWRVSRFSFVLCLITIIRIFLLERIETRIFFPPPLNRARSEDELGFSTCPPIWPLQVLLLKCLNFTFAHFVRDGGVWSQRMSVRFKW